MKKYKLIFILYLFAISCTNKLELELSSLGFDFFPLEKGNYWIYEVTQIDYLNTGDIEEINFQIKIIIDDSLETIQDTDIWRAFQLIRENPNSQWRSNETLLIERNPRNLSITENNLTIIRLAFPPSEGKTWDANARNNLSADNFQVRNLFKSFIIEQDTFPNTLSIIQSDNNDSIIFLDKRIEVFQQEVGMVYSVFSQLDFCRETACLGLQQIDFGTTRFWRLVESGQEN